MPETFGGGVPFAPRDGRPLGLGRFHLNPGDTATHGPFPSGGTACLCALDIVSYGGGTGGFMPIRLINTPSVIFMTINIGSNEDAFSWRGLIPLLSTDQLEFHNVSDTDVDVTASGMWVPTEYFAV